jgi:ADP-ribose pyrophosphatase
MSRELESLYRTKYLELVSSGKWQWVSRPHPVVCVIALTDARELLLVEQYRVPVDARVIELPAGLVGDEAEAGGEPLLEAARRELLEETGYEAASVQEVFTGVTSAGLTDETTTFVLASGLRKVSDSIGVGDEQIELHLAPLDELDTWLDRWQGSGRKVDARVLAGVYLLRRSQP